MGRLQLYKWEMLQVNKQTIPANSSMWLVTFTHTSLSQTVTRPVNLPSNQSSLSHTSYNSHRTTMTKPKPLQLKEIKRLAICLEWSPKHFPQVHHKTWHSQYNRNPLVAKEETKPIKPFSLHPIRGPFTRDFIFLIIPIVFRGSKGNVLLQNIFFK